MRLTGKRLREMTEEASEGRYIDLGTWTDCRTERVHAFIDKERGWALCGTFGSWSSTSAFVWEHGTTWDEPEKLGSFDASFLQGCETSSDWVEAARVISEHIRTEDF